MAKIIDGRAISAQIKEEVKQEAKALAARGIKVCLAVVQVGDHPASSVYVRNKQRACAACGIKSLEFHLPESCGQEDLLRQIRDLNAREDVDGILVQLPLPRQIDADAVIEAIDPAKDVDGFLPENLGRLLIGQDGFLPCTPAGILELLKRSHIPLEGKECLVLGRSNIVGKPVALLMLREHATVTIAHSRTANLPELMRRADILIAAIGRADFVKGADLKEGAVVIDVGINRMEDGSLHGDVDYEDAFDRVSAITPVPGGVGPMTIAMLMKNCLRAARARRS
ncbi:tetrahydrofolate dehydrogenase/cyclohydrolase, NAD(P)-binding domain protein [Shuttleworthella sp. MSX8B]|uniref:bifunctional methylenetetrahydrofolate dehydrogenase/methenyltetrahydrofolate cyclohydrolase FolD n=1 Tax=Shuttleworthella sp. MSX8B TaxID=936574 RepID=UPI0004468D72|nr:bifunctional methylenetetrahydrofolate dehydrogenase/methenyltetrahydrofolate cyclohydrolase FolD [Shuttleworthia sp. MSX8B]EUB17481.1 tetrahydrofolate dehydrogenase/cyclohydrolase, NAD(P)-binding domain protein [Shuttleworthia sp. MSX8B]